MPLSYHVLSGAFIVHRIEHTGLRLEVNLLICGARDYLHELTIHVCALIRPFLTEI